MDNRRKRSLDEILADLNKILGKMPDLVEKVKPIEIKPIDFGEVLDKNISLNSNTNLPSENNNTVDISKTSNIDGQQENVQETKNDMEKSPAMFETDRNIKLDIPEDEAKTNKEENETTINILENTNDFVVPDIDALLNLSEKEKENSDIKEGDVRADGSAIGGVMEGEESKKTDDLQVDNLETGNLNSDNSLDLKNIELNTDLQINKIDETRSQAKNGIKEDTALELNADAGDNSLSDSLGDKTLINSTTENNNSDQIDKNIDLKFEVNSPEKKEDGELSFDTINMDGIKLEDADKKEADVNLEVKKDSQEEKTMLFNPEQNNLSLGSEDKTVLFTPGEDLGTSASSCNSLEGYEEIIKNIPDERIKNIGVITAFDQEFTALVLKNIDEICLSSKDRPMFIKRAFTINYTDEINANFILEKAKENNVVAVLSIGDFPSEKNYELNAVFSTAKIIFKNIDHASFNKTNILDFIMDVITAL